MQVPAHAQLVPTDWANRSNLRTFYRLSQTPETRWHLHLTRHLLMIALHHSAEMSTPRSRDVHMIMWQGLCKAMWLHAKIVSSLHVLDLPSEHVSWPAPKVRHPLDLPLHKSVCTWLV